MSDWPEPSDLFLEISSTLDRWADENALSWQRIYKDYSVRSISFPLPGSESVQIWIDPPEADPVTIHVALNSSLASRRKVRSTTHSRAGLQRGLDEALRMAREWLAHG